MENLKNNNNLMTCFVVLHIQSYHRPPVSAVHEIIWSDSPKVNALDLSGDAGGNGQERTEGAVHFSGSRAGALPRTNPAGAGDTDQQHQHQAHA